MSLPSKLFPIVSSWTFRWFLFISLSHSWCADNGWYLSGDKFADNNKILTQMCRAQISTPIELILSLSRWLTLVRFRSFVFYMIPSWGKQDGLTTPTNLLTGEWRVLNIQLENIITGISGFYVFSYIHIVFVTWPDFLTRYQNSAS